MIKTKRRDARIMNAAAHDISAGQQRAQLVEVAWSFGQPVEVLGFQRTKKGDGVAR